jgi:hypothetical protein
VPVATTIPTATVTLPIAPTALIQPTTTTLTNTPVPP